jgi:predicted neuraminidase
MQTIAESVPLPALVASQSDMGRTFGIGYPTELPNGNSGIDVTKLAGGVLVLAMNPRRSNWGERYPLRLTLSTDNGRTWPTHLDVESEPGEYSYPAIIPWADGNGVHLLYTWRRSKMRYFSASLKELQRRSETTDWGEFEDRRKK